MNVFGYLEEVILLFKELLCNLSLLYILELSSMLTLLYMMCTSGLLWYLNHLNHNILYKSIDPRVCFFKQVILEFFHNFFLGRLKQKKLEIFRRHIKVPVVKISGSELLYF
jgi:hypothetical protein